MKICILTIATNKYIRFVEKLYTDISEKFLPGAEINCLLFTDHEIEEAGNNVRVHYIDHEPWPMPTLKRYNYFVKEKDFILEHDYCFYFDADMRIDNPVGEEVLEEHKKNLDPSWPVPLYTTTINSCQNICLLELSFAKPNVLTQLCTETNRLKELLNDVNNSNKRQKRNVGVYDEVMNIQTKTPKTQYNAHLFNSRQILQQNRICGSCSKRVLQCTHYEWLNAADKEDHTEKE